jgi:2-polyprenyl-3-methyl-5-hydroxy-6-metoxy-1,4-benzoquinol methylase
MSTDRSFGQEYSLTPVDRFGIWLSARRIRAEAGRLTGKRIADFGCGYDATFVRTVLHDVTSAALVDVSLADDLKQTPNVHAVEGTLPDAIAEYADGSFDVVMCMSVLEHLEQPTFTLQELRRVLAPGGVLLVNVPSWRGKRMLELSAFRLGLSPAESIDDHKAYYDPRDLWPLLVEVGFRPRQIKCFRHKFGLNTFAVCRADG